MSETEQQESQKTPTPAFNLPAIVSWLTGAMVGVHLLRLLIPRTADYLLVEFLAFDSSVYTDPGVREAKAIAMILGPVTHMFVHADAVHLAVNAGLFVGFGAVIARRMSASWFVLFFLLCGVAGALTWLVMHPHSPALLIGASGAVSGMIGAATRLGIFRMPSPGGPPPFRNRQQAISLAVIWILLNVAIGLTGGRMFGLEEVVAWQAHLGGFVVGYLLIGSFDGRDLRRLGDADQPM